MILALPGNLGQGSGTRGEVGAETAVGVSGFGLSKSIQDSYL
jgi:hypothetical protein